MNDDVLWFLNMSLDCEFIKLHRVNRVFLAIFANPVYHAVINVLLSFVRRLGGA